MHKSCSNVGFQVDDQVDNDEKKWQWWQDHEATFVLNETPTTVGNHAHPHPPHFHSHPPHFLPHKPHLPPHLAHLSLPPTHIQQHNLIFHRLWLTTFLFFFSSMVLLVARDRIVSVSVFSCLFNIVSVPVYICQSFCLCLCLYLYLYVSVKHSLCSLDLSLLLSLYVLALIFTVFVSVWVSVHIFSRLSPPGCHPLYFSV